MKIIKAIRELVRHTVQCVVQFPYLKPTFYFVVAAGQFGPPYEPWGWERIIDCALRFFVAFVCVQMAIRELLAEVKLNPTGQRTGGIE